MRRLLRFRSAAPATCVQASIRTLVTGRDLPATSKQGEAFTAERHEGSEAAAAACPEGDEELAGMRVGALRMMQHGAGRAKDKEQAQLRRAGLRTGGSSTSWLKAGGVEDQSKDVRRSNIADRQFLTNDGAGGRNPFERARNATKTKLQKSVFAATDYRMTGSFGQDAGTSDDRDLEEIEQDVEDAIQIAVANGEFDNLDGQGKPLKSILAGENPFLDDAERIGFGLLQKHGFAPEWIEQQKRIHRDIESFVQELGDSWTASNFEPSPAFVTQKDRFRKELSSLNRRVRDYNLNCPQSAQMVPFELPDEVRRAKRLAESRPVKVPATASFVPKKPRMTPLREVFAAQRAASRQQSGSTRSIWSRVADAFKPFGT